MPLGESQLQPGVVLDNTYRMCDLVGHGGMGAVWRAEHLRLPKEVAVKVLRDVMTGTEAYARFRREAEIASRLGHPHIVEALDFNILPDGAPYLVLEYLRGQSLRQRLKQGALGLELTVHLTRQMASALQAAHAQGVVHRDLKPENVFLCQVGGEAMPHVKILDFGISRILSAQTSLTQEGTIFGTAQYMAPEQAEGRVADAAADQYSLAVMVYEMLCARPAFEGTTPVQVMFQVVHASPPSLSGLVPNLPAGVYATVARGLSKDPAARFPDVMTFARELARVAGISLGTTPSPEPSPLPTTPDGDPMADTVASGATAVGDIGLGTTVVGDDTPGSAAPRHNPWALFALGALAMGAIGGGAYYWSIRRSGQPTQAQVSAAHPVSPTTVPPPATHPVSPTMVQPPVSRPAAPDPVQVAASRPAPVALRPPTPPPPGLPSAPVRPPLKPEPAPRRPNRAVGPGLRNQPDDLPPDLQAEVKAGLAQLRSGDPMAALATADRLLAKLPARHRWLAYMIKTRAHCVRLEFEKARATVHHVPRPMRKLVDPFCRRHLTDW